MSATPNTLEEAVASLEKFLNHDTTAAALKGIQPTGATPVQDMRALNESRDDFELRLVSEGCDPTLVPMHIYYVASVAKTQLTLVIFAPKSTARLVPSFGFWDKDVRALCGVSTNRISSNVRTLQRIYALLVEAAILGNKGPDMCERI